MTHNNSTGGLSDIRNSLPLVCRKNGSPFFAQYVRGNNSIFYLEIGKQRIGKSERHVGLLLTAAFFTFVYFRRNEQPSVNLALPPVGWQRTVEHPAQMTTVWACEKTTVIVKQPGHLTSMKKDRGTGTSIWRMENCIRNGAIEHVRGIIPSDIP